MDITCDSCKTRLNIPDEKLPEGKKVAVNCPKCKAKLMVGRPPRKGEDKNTADDAEPKAPVNRKEVYIKEPTEADDFIEFLAEDKKLALVMEDSDLIADKIRETIEGLGFKNVRAENTRDAIARMREYHFDFVILSQRFDGIELEQSPVLEYLNHLSMYVRRRMFLVLVGEEFQTMDLLMAFAMSANLVVNSNDLENLPRALKQSLMDNKRFYSLFFDILAEVGKA
jgi:predicted Zn finger-like uncharacterized protein